ncbi:hypothetical protein, variant [Aphanomyces invadans]|uniref:PA domain-containing protein n=1 Tax=Aphanomyces invadans TaxID=157072 RepID=A0A024TV94_9STRA|nr:hypothetical protein, variant [Aphanomyces invadans]ETV98100.1 hypothetical protein, variant [Aphanomyces invadans]|eukprot:XP_008872975.1 hypothetical protein, variant [Aphanomyces invadans]
MATASYDDMLYARRIQRAQELFCADCQATVPVLSHDDRRCSACGADLQPRPATQSLPSDTTNGISSLMNRLLEVWGIDPTSTSTQPASEEAVAKLNTFAAGQATTVEVALVASGIKGEVIVVPANFGPCESIESSPVVISSPFHGNGPLANASTMQGKIVLFERGVCTFASKIQRAQDAGAKAVVVVQTTDVWPYVMTDSTGEGISLTIPAFIISKKQGQGLVQYLHDHPDTTMSIDARKDARECVICQVDVQVGVQVVQMPCQVLHPLENRI